MPWFVHEDIWIIEANDQSVPSLDYFSILQLDDFQYEFLVYAFHEVKTDEIEPRLDQRKHKALRTENYLLPVKILVKCHNTVSNFV